MTKNTQERQSDRGHLALMGLFIIATCSFLYDTLAESFRLENVIVILPVSLLVIVLCLVQVKRHVAAAKLRSNAELVSDGESIDTDVPVDAFLTRFRIPLFMALLGCYILGLLYFAFDISTFLFLFGALVLQREKHLIFGALFCAALSIALTWGLKHMVSFPFPTMLF